MRTFHVEIKRVLSDGVPQAGVPPQVESVHRGDVQAGHPDDAATAAKALGRKLGEKDGLIVRSCSFTNPTALLVYIGAPKEHAARPGFMYQGPRPMAGRAPR